FCAKQIGSTLAMPPTTKKKTVESTLGITLKAFNQYEPFQISSHYSATKDQITMTGLLLICSGEKVPELIKITFVRTKGVLVTVADGSSMSTLVRECETHKSSRDDVLATMLDML